MQWYLFEGARDRGTATSRIIVTDVNDVVRSVGIGQTVELDADVRDKFNTHAIMTAVDDDMGFPAGVLGGAPAPSGGVQGQWPFSRVYNGPHALSVTVDDHEPPSGIKLDTITFPSPRRLVSLSAFVPSMSGEMYGDPAGWSASDLILSLVPKDATWANTIKTNTYAPVCSVNFNNIVDVPEPPPGWFAQWTTQGASVMPILMGDATGGVMSECDLHLSIGNYEVDESITVDSIEVWIS